eukprot:2475496-Pyramimonas_sp.AAC.1
MHTTKAYYAQACHQPVAGGSLFDLIWVLLVPFLNATGITIGPQLGYSMTQSGQVLVGLQLGPDGIPTACPYESKREYPDWIPMRYPSCSPIWFRW